MTNRPIRKREMGAREKAMQAARFAREEGLSLDDAARRAGAKLSTAGLALFVLNNGTEQEIAQAWTFEVSTGVLAQSIRSRVPRVERTRKAPVTGEVNKMTGATDSAIYERLRDALDGINSMPRPADVVAIVKAHRVRADVLNKRLIDAYAWLMEFSDAWTK